MYNEQNFALSPTSHSSSSPLLSSLASPLSKFLNFSMVPLYMRTTFTGCCAFVWATFLCFSRQSGDGTANAALAWMFTPKQDTTTEPEVEKLGPKVDQTGPKVDQTGPKLDTEGPKPENPSPKEETNTHR